MVKSNEFKPVSSDYWETPPELVRGILLFLKHINLIEWEDLRFQLDCCATPINAKAPNYITEEQNALTSEWNFKQVWCNPPYSRGALQLFISKAMLECKERGCEVVMLMNVDTGTKYFQEIVKSAKAIVFITGGRIRFLDPDTRRPVKTGFHPSMFVLFSPNRNVDYPFTYYVTRDELLKAGEHYII